MKIKRGKLCKVPRTMPDIPRHLTGRINTLLSSPWKTEGDDLKQSLLHTTNGKVGGAVQTACSGNGKASASGFFLTRNSEC